MSSLSKCSPSSLQAVVLAVVLGGVGLAIGIRPINDPDFGWHLAGGLWMLDLGSIPTRDPFGSDGLYWLAYSWLVELIGAIVFRLGGFYLLQWLQTAVNCSTVFFIAWYIQALSKTQQIESAWAKSVACAVCIICASPAMYLRPQGMSIFFAALCVLWMEQQRVSPFRWFGLTVLWANIHVLWILAPACYLASCLERLLETRDLKASLRTFLSALCVAAGGIFTPYGFLNLQAPLGYLFDHQVGNRVISELQPLDLSVALFLYLVIFLTVWFGLSVSTISQKHSKVVLLFFLGCSAQSVLHIRYLPFFGLAAAPFLLQLIDQLSIRIRPMFCRYDANKMSIKLSRLRLVLAVALLLTFGFLVAVELRIPPVLSGKNRELLQIAQDLSEDANFSGTEPVPVFTHFDHGGWLALGFYLNRQPDQTESRFKTMIDSRTLMIPQTKLAEFEIIRTQSAGWCETLSKWDPQVLVLPKGKKISGAIGASLNSESPTCLGNLRRIKETTNWFVVERN